MAKEFDNAWFIALLNKRNEYEEGKAAAALQLEAKRDQLEALKGEAVAALAKGKTEKYNHLAQQIAALNTEIEIMGRWIDSGAETGAFSEGELEKAWAGYSASVAPYITEQLEAMREHLEEAQRIYRALWPVYEQAQGIKRGISMLGGYRWPGDERLQDLPFVHSGFGSYTRPLE